MCVTLWTYRSSCFEAEWRDLGLNSDYETYSYYNLTVWCGGVEGMLGPRQALAKDLDHSLLFILYIYFSSVSLGAKCR